MFGLLGAIIVGAVMGWAAEQFGFTRMGLVPAVTTAVGGAVIAFFLLALFGIGFYGRTGTAAIGAAIALFLAPRMRR
ncbi:MAG: hypothetical protein AAGH68_15640 [Pseudomonadota bacterium]